MISHEPDGDPTESDGAPRDDRVGVDVVDVVVGLVLALLVLGPALAPGPLLDLDLLVTPEIPVPNGIWGLGPELSQRVPLFALLGIGSWVVGGPVAVKAFLVLGLTIGFVGMSRAVGSGVGRPARYAAAILWVAGPFVVTRLAAGHLQFVWLIALLPWTLPDLLTPSRRPARTFVSTVLLAAGGPATGAIASAVVVVGWAAGRFRRPGSVVGSLIVANLLWAAPTVVLLWAGAEVAGADRFATDASGVDGWLGVLSGGGFWLPDRQIGARGWIGVLAGLSLVTVAVRGVWRRPWADRPLRAVGLVGLVLTGASALPVVRDGYAALSRLPVGAPLRESQRFLLLWLAWLAPAVAAGAEDVADRLTRSIAGRGQDGLTAMGRVLPLAAVLLVSVGGWWGGGGVMAPVEFPAGWAEARRYVTEHAGSVVALPWNEYPTLDFIGGRHALDPVPDYLGGDVISSFDPLFEPGASAQEQVDRRARHVDRGLRGDGPLGPIFEAVGARHLVVVEQRGAAAVTRRLEGEPDAFERVLENPDVTVWAVRAWRGPVVAPDGTVHDLDRPIPPLVRTDAPPGSVVDMAGAPGWVRGWFHPAGITPEGRLVLPDSGGGRLWFWPGPLLVAMDLVLLGSALVMHRSERSRGIPRERLVILL